MSDFNNLKLEVAEEIAVLTISRPAAKMPPPVQ